MTSKTPEVKDIVIYKGVTLETILWTETDNNGDPVDLTGYSVESQVRTSYDSDTVELSLTERITLGTDGTATLKLIPMVTASVSFEKGVYDVKLVTPEDDIWRRCFGIVWVKEMVTRDDGG